MIDQNKDNMEALNKKKPTRTDTLTIANGLWYCVGMFAKEIRATREIE